MVFGCFKDYLIRGGLETTLQITTDLCRENPPHKSKPPPPAGQAHWLLLENSEHMQKLADWDSSDTCLFHSINCPILEILSPLQTQISVQTGGTLNLVCRGSPSASRLDVNRFLSAPVASPSLTSFFNSFSAAVFSFLITPETGAMRRTSDILQPACVVPTTKSIFSSSIKFVFMETLAEAITAQFQAYFRPTTCLADWRITSK